MGKPGIVEHIKHSVNFKVLDSKWIQETPNVCVSGADGFGGIIQCFRMDSDSGQLDSRSTIRRSKPIKCISFGLPSKNQVAAGSSCGRLQIMWVSALDISFSGILQVTHDSRGLNIYCPLTCILFHVTPFFKLLRDGKMGTIETAWMLTLSIK